MVKREIASSDPLGRSSIRQPPRVGTGTGGKVVRALPGMSPCRGKSLAMPDLSYSLFQRFELTNGEVTEFYPTGCRRA